MQQQLGMEVQKLLDVWSNPAFQVGVVLVALGVFFTGVGYHYRKLVLPGMYAPFVSISRRVKNAHARYLAFRGRRELEMNKKRSQALKERAAAALINWLNYEVFIGNITWQESNDMQKFVARAMRHPDMMPLFDPEFVKNQIKARRAKGIHKPVRLPGMSRRETLRHTLSS